MNSIRNKLLMICAGGTLLVLLAAGSGMLVQSRTIERLGTGEPGRLQQAHVALVESKIRYYDELLGWKNALLRGAGGESPAPRRDAFDQAEAAVEQQVGRLIQASGNDPQIKDLAERFLAAHKALGERYRLVLDQRAGGLVPPVLQQQLRDADLEASALLDRLSTHLTNTIARQTSEIHANARRAVALSFALIVATCAVAFALLHRLMRRQLAARALELESALKRLATGDLSVPIDARGEDELGRIAASAESLRCELGGLVRSVSVSVKRVDDAAAGLASGTRRAGGGEAATPNARNLPAATPCLAGDPPRREAGDTAQAEQRLKMLAASIQETATVMKAVTDTASSFIRNSQEIRNMTRQVREIAEQTNLLALNAAIEAARAGKKGQEFASIAEEVRKLAEKTGQSAGEIDAITSSLAEQAQLLDHELGRGMAVLESSRSSMPAGPGPSGAAASPASRTSADSGEAGLAVREAGPAGNRIARQVEEIALMVEASHTALGKMSDTAQALHRVADELKARVGGFRM